MGGLGPGIGGSELIVIGLVALLVVGPKDLPLLMRRVGQAIAKARGMANEFRASFDEMARQSELDDLRKEVEALRRGQGMHPLGDEASAAFKDINQSLNAPTTYTPLPAPTADAAASPTPATSEWPDPVAVQPAAGAEVTTKPKRTRAAAKPKAKAAVKAEVAVAKPVVTGKVAARRAAAAKPAAAAEPAEPASAPKPARKPRKKAATS